MTAESAPGELAASARERFGQAIDELLDLLQRLRLASVKERRQVYAACIPLIGELTTLNKPPFPVRRIKALTHEANWHLRSLAGLAQININEDDDHAGWALASLQALAVCRHEYEDGPPVP